MYRTIDDFVADWQNESQATQKLMDRLSDRSLAQQVDAEGRTLGGLAWHIVVTPREMLERAGVEVEGPGPEEAAPGEAGAIAARYREVARSVGEQVRAAWTDADLDTTVEMYGDVWSRATVLSVLIRHEAHHRGQMTVLMRQAGLAVPGMYGPAREEWQAMGVPPLP